MSRHPETSGATSTAEQSALRLCPGIAWREEAAGFLLYHAAGDTLYEANRIAGEAVRLLAAGTPPESLSRVLAGDYSVPVAQVQSDVAELLEFLSGEGIVVGP